MNSERLTPKHWHTHIGLGLLFLCSRLPLSFQYTLGKKLGIMLFPLLKSRRHIALTNIKLCFPELNEKQQVDLAKESFGEVAIGLLEAAYIWWNKPADVLKHTDFLGIELIEEALKQGKGILLIGAHFPSIEIAGALISQKIDLDVTYRKQKNKIMDDIIFRKRQQHFKHVIERTNTRRFLRSLKENRVVWYAPDQDYGTRHSVFSKFFGVTAASIVATTRILNFNQSPVLFLSHHRNKNNRYQISISKLDSHLPSGSELTDAQIINKKIETEIRKYPSQYMWTHRRFKSRPDGEKSVY